MLDIEMTTDDRDALAMAHNFLSERSRYYATTTLKRGLSDKFAKCADAVCKVLNAEEVTT